MTLYRELEKLLAKYDARSSLYADIAEIAAYHKTCLKLIAKVPVKVRRHITVNQKVITINNFATEIDTYSGYIDVKVRVSGNWYTVVEQGTVHDYMLKVILVNEETTRARGKGTETGGESTISSPTRKSNKGNRGSSRAKVTKRLASKHCRTERQRACRKGKRVTKVTK